MASALGTYVRIPPPLSLHLVGSSVPTKALLTQLVTLVPKGDTATLLCVSVAVSAAFLYTVS